MEEVKLAFGQYKLNKKKKKLQTWSEQDAHAAASRCARGAADSCLGAARPAEGARWSSRPERPPAPLPPVSVPPPPRRPRAPATPSGLSPLVAVITSQWGIFPGQI